MIPSSIENMQHLWNDCQTLNNRYSLFEYAPCTNKKWSKHHPTIEPIQYWAGSVHQQPKMHPDLKAPRRAPPEFMHNFQSSVSLTWCPQRPISSSQEKKRWWKKPGMCRSWFEYLNITFSTSKRTIFIGFRLLARRQMCTTRVPANLHQREAGYLIESSFWIWRSGPDWIEFKYYNAKAVFAIPI